MVVPSELPVALVLGDTGNSSCPWGLQTPYLQQESASVPRWGGVLGLQVPEVGRERNVLCELLGQGLWGITLCLHLFLAAELGHGSSRDGGGNVCFFQLGFYDCCSIQHGLCKARFKNGWKQVE